MCKHYTEEQKALKFGASYAGIENPPKLPDRVEVWPKRNGLKSGLPKSWGGSDDIITLGTWQKTPTRSLFKESCMGTEWSFRTGKVIRPGIPSFSENAE